MANWAWITACLDQSHRAAIAHEAFIVRRIAQTLSTRVADPDGMWMDIEMEADAYVGAFAQCVDDGPTSFQVPVRERCELQISGTALTRADLV